MYQIATKYVPITFGIWVLHPISIGNTTRGIMDGNFDMVASNEGTTESIGRTYTILQ